MGTLNRVPRRNFLLVLVDAVDEDHQVVAYYVFSRCDPLVTD